MKHDNAIITILVIMLLFISTGCGTLQQAYPGAKRPDEEVAHITATDRWHRDIQIFKCDDQKLKAFTKEVDVLPGPHNIQVGMTQFIGIGNKYVDQTVPIRCDAGRTYQIDGDGNKLWATDITTNKTASEARH